MKSAHNIKKIFLLKFVIIVFLLNLSSITMGVSYTAYFQNDAISNPYGNSNGNENINNNGSFALNSSTQLNSAMQISDAFFLNKGQINDLNIKYYYLTDNLFIGFLKSKISFSYLISGEATFHSFNLSFTNSYDVEPVGVNGSNSLINIFQGTNSYVGLNFYKEIIYKNIYENIDLCFYIISNRIKYDFISHSGNINQIRLNFSNNVDLNINPSTVNLKTRNTIVNFETNLKVFDEDTGNSIPASFVQFSQHSYGYQLFSGTNNYRNVVIDPIIFSKILVSSSNEFGFDVGNVIKVDSNGNIYVAGKTTSDGFLTQDALNSTYNGGPYDAVLMKFDKNWNLLFSTYIGGSGEDTAESLTFDAQNNIYLSGTTYSNDFPVTNRFDVNNSSISPNTTRNANIFFLKLSSDGQKLIFSDIIGGEGTDTNSQIILDNTNEIIVAGFTNSNLFPYTNTSLSLSNLRQNVDVSNYFIAKFSNNGSKLLACSLLQDSYTFFPILISMGLDNSLIIAGSAYENITTTSDALDRTWNGHLDVFLERVNLTNFQLIYDTFIGGEEQDQVNGLFVDANNSIYLTGQTNSLDYPTTSNAFSNHLVNSWDVFVTKLSPDAKKIIYSTYIGGSDNDYATAIVVDQKGSAYITGYTKSGDFPTTANSMISNNLALDQMTPTKSSLNSFSKPNSDSFTKSSLSHTNMYYNPFNPDVYISSLTAESIFLTKLSPDGSKLYYSTLIGGSQSDIANSIDINKQDHIFITGGTTSMNFPSFYRNNVPFYSSKIFVLEFYDLPSDDLKFALSSIQYKSDPILTFLINYFFVMFFAAIIIIYVVILLSKKFRTEN